MSDERDAVAAEVEEPRREQPRDDEYERTRNARREEAKAEDEAERNQSDEQRRPVDAAEPADPRTELAPRVLAGRLRPRQLRQLADHDIDRGAGEEPGHDRARQESRDPAEPQDREQQEESAGDERDRSDQLGGLRPSHSRDEHCTAGNGGER